MKRDAAPGPKSEASEDHRLKGLQEPPLKETTRGYGSEQEALASTGELGCVEGPALVGAGMVDGYDCDDAPW